MALSLTLAFALVPVTALFAGLTIGLLGLDVTALSILEHAGEVKEREYARKILPVRKQVGVGLVKRILYHYGEDAPGGGGNPLYI